MRWFILLLPLAALLFFGSERQVEAQTAPGFVKGTVVDEVGQPAWGAAVTAHPLASGSPLHTYADNEGKFVLSLSAGEWQIEFETPDRTWGLFVNEWYEDQPDRTSADIVVVEPGAVIPLNATLTRNGKIWGRVSSISEPALADVCVDLELFGSIVATTRTGPDGMYEFTELSPFGYGLTFSDCDPGINRIKSETLPTTVNLNWGSMQQQVDHRVTLQTVIFGRVVNTDGAPVPNMCAELGLTRDIPAYYPLQLERTDADGRFVFNNLDHRTRYYWRIYDCNPDDLQYFPGSLRQAYLDSEGEDYEASDEVLLRSSSISGRVTDTQGNPIRGIEVRARSSRGSNRYATTASDGTYTVEWLRPVSDTNAGYTVTFDCGSSWCPYAPYEHPEQVSIPVDNTHITGIDAVLYRPARIYGSIVDEAGNRLTGISVYLYQDGQIVKRGSTNFYGNISWTYGSNLKPGDYTLHFVDNGWCTYWDWWRGECREWGREPNTYQDHWYQRQRDEQTATILNLADGESVVLNITMLPWGEYFTTPVEIDIKPHDADNVVSCRNERALIPVALMSSDEFDATSVDESTITFGPGRAGLFHQDAHPEDVNGDGRVDLVMHFRLGDTGLVCGDSVAVFTAKAATGEALEGSDVIRLFEPGE